MPRKKSRGGANAQNNAAVQQLVAMLSRMAVAPARKSKTKRKRRAGNKPAMGGGDGVIHLSRDELVTTIKVTKNTTSSTGHFDLVPSSFSFLKGIAKSFDRLVWNKIHIFYKPAVGSTFGGLVTYGVDWDFVTTNDIGRERISSLTPSATLAAWSDNQTKPLVLQPAKIQSRRFFSPNATTEDNSNKGPGKIHWATSVSAQAADTIVGELWVSYSVTMQGTNPQ